ncbi:DUF6470 family protein [Sporomusa sphaeroides]|uniref:YviE n=1 Tax=Sporomusa sphaeroides DSM 2875 TaxID=1337886 RepID=A0ABM9W414_9FIRM|nr:DUF6470 family protein [Sporomusa sphaeroides]OLS55565.1 hypothetical protein SPSPH_36130 [Sporomusa sphaeroides DSM 2875]CVK19898.1 hypothetical protein SSPH_02565 [Sporomusa sphaeroides DSM 2875]
MLTLNISTQPAKTSITTTRADMGLTTTRPQLRIDTEPATVEISQPKGELEIDWEAFRASYGKKTNIRLARDNADLGRQTAFDTIARIAQEGDRLMNAEVSGEDPIPAMAAEANTQLPPEVTWARLEPPVIRYTAHQPIFKPTPGRLTIDVIPGKVNMDFRPATVDIRMVQYPSIKMWVTDNSVDISA